MAFAVCIPKKIHRISVYLYVVDLRTELNGFCLLASYNGTYVMTVNADDAVPDLLPYKHFLFLYKNLSDDGKTFLVILGIAKCASVLPMNLIPLYEELFKKLDHTALEHPCP